MIDREKLIRDAANDFVCETQYMVDNVAMAFIEGARWADETMLQKVLEWLKKHTYSIYDRKEHCDFGINFESEEQMLQSFKNHFNISE